MSAEVELLSDDENALYDVQEPALFYVALWGLESVQAPGAEINKIDAILSFKKIVHFKKYRTS